MASYIDQTLTKGEVVLVRGRVALRRYWLSFMIAGLLAFTAIFELFVTPVMALFTILFALLFVGPPVIRYLTNELALTNRRVVAKTGLVSLHTTEIKLGKIESIEVNQGLFGKMLNYGTVEITGTGGSHAIIPNISDPVLFRKHFASATDEPVLQNQYGTRAAVPAG